MTGGGTEDWPLKRRIVSRAACLMGNVLVPISDATSGFFAIRKTALDGVKLNPIGFKIGFEVMARGRYKKVVEVPYVFRDRELGKSKFGRREIGQYLVQSVRSRAIRSCAGSDRATTLWACVVLVVRMDWQGLFECIARRERDRARHDLSDAAAPAAFLPNRKSAASGTRPAARRAPRDVVNGALIRESARSPTPPSWSRPWSS